MTTALLVIAATSCALTSLTYAILRRGGIETQAALLLAASTLWVAAAAIDGTALQTTAGTACTLIALGLWWYVGGNRRIEPFFRRRITKRIANRAFAALDAVLEGDCNTGHEITSKVLARYGSGAAYPLALTWSTTAAQLVADQGKRPDGSQMEFGGLTFVNPLTGERAAGDEVPPEIRWSGLVIEATTRFDRGRVAALVGALPGDVRGRERHLGELLHMTAAAVAVRSIAVSGRRDGS